MRVTSDAAKGRKESSAGRTQGGLKVSKLSKTRQFWPGTTAFLECVLLSPVVS